MQLQRMIKWIFFSHTVFTESKKSYYEDLGLANIHKQMSILEAQEGGIENIGCARKDVYNSKRYLRAKCDEQDAELLREYFLGKKQKNHCFNFKMKAYYTKSLCNFLRIEARSIWVYGFYGDVVVFDTTYNTNRYGMIFAP